MARDKLVTSGQFENYRLVNGRSKHPALELRDKGFSNDSFSISLRFTLTAHSKIAFCFIDSTIATEIVYNPGIFHAEDGLWVGNIINCAITSLVECKTTDINKPLLNAYFCWLVTPIPDKCAFRLIMQTAKPTVLIIDDSDEDRLLYKRYLDSDYTVLEADLGRKGINLIREINPSCVLLDYRLPDIDGLEIMREICQATSLEMPAIVFLTGYADTQLAVSAMQAGALDFLEKNRATPASLKQAVLNSTEKARLHRELDDQRKLFSATLSAITNAVVTIDATRCVVFMNNAASVINKTPLNEVLGKCVGEVLQLIDEEPGLNWQTMLNQALSGQALSHIARPAKLITQDGNSVSVQYSLAASQSSVGVVCVLVIQDMSQSEKLKAEKNHAETANRSKSVFLANMSHEIRTPMNAIIGFTHILSGTGLAPKQEEMLGYITKAANHLLYLINDILDLSKIEAGQLILEQMPFFIANVVADVNAIFAAQLQSKPIKFLTEMKGVPEQMLGDPMRLSQVLINYMGNALKFTESGLIKLHIRVLAETDDDYMIRFEVQDTGIGIPPERLDKVFEAFEQVDNSTTRKYGGTGLGLAINKRLAFLMGGEVGVESVLGQGSRFWLTARLGKVRGATYTPKTASNNADPVSALQGASKGRRILLVEDDPLNQEIALELLSEVAGLQVDVAGHGQQAVDMAGNTVYELILMDMQMPVMNGLEATKLIRKLPAYHQTPILAMTANAFQDDRERCLEAGMNEFISKPVLPNDLYAILLKWLATPI